MAENNTIQSKGRGNWSFHVYQPESEKRIIGPFKGTLEITKDFHSVTNDQMCLVIVPSPNVAYVVNSGD